MAFGSTFMIGLCYISDGGKGMWAMIYSHKSITKSELGVTVLSATGKSLKGWLETYPSLFLNHILYGIEALSKSC